MHVLKAIAMADLNKYLKWSFILQYNNTQNVEC